MKWNDKPLATVEDVESIEADLDALRGELQGPAWLTPARFTWEATARTVTTTNIGEVEDNNWSVLTRKRVVETTPEYDIRPDIIRNQWDAEMDVSLDGPATLVPVGDGSYTLLWADGTPTGTTATVTGQLGDWCEVVTVAKHSAGSIVTQDWFEAFAPGSVGEAMHGVFAAWTNKPYGGYRFANYPKAAFTNWEQRTNGYVLASHCWEENADLSGVSYLADSATHPYYRPGTLVASNLCYGAAHFSHAVGTRLAWMGKDGQPHASTIVAQRRMTGDMCLSMLSPPLDPAVCTAYPILDIDEAGNKVRADGVSGIQEYPLLAMSQGQRAWIMRGGSTSFGGGAYGFFDFGTGEYIRNSRNCAVGGDSGHPVFVSTDGVHLVLYGAYWTPNGISVPGAMENKPLIRQAAESMGADPDSIRFETFADWPTYLGPGLNMGASSPGGSEDAEDEGE